VSFPSGVWVGAPAKIEFGEFLQRVSIACYAERCISYRILSDRPSDRLSVTVWHCVKTSRMIEEWEKWAIFSQ